MHEAPQACNAPHMYYYNYIGTEQIEEASYPLHTFNWCLWYDDRDNRLHDVAGTGFIGRAMMYEASSRH